VPAATFDGNAAAFDQVLQAATIGRGDDAVGVAIVRDGQVVHEFAAGTENALLGTSATPASRFRLASISKVLAATVVMQLVEEGRIQLDEPFLDQYGSDAAIGDQRMRSITVRHLLSHTSGLSDAWARFFDGGATTWQEAATAGLADTLQFDPGSMFQYSNTNFCLLGLLIERVTGMPYEQAVTERVLAPLGITDMRMAGTFDVQFGDVVHRSGPGRNYMEVLGPAGAWVGSAADTARIVAALSPSGGSLLLEPGTVDRMRQPAIALPPALGWNYGLGLRLFANGSWGHTGTVERTRAIAVNRPDGTTVSVMVAGDVPWSTDDLLDTIDAAFAAS
jgi:D-alanyl-D-alanine carboxypeptidase